MKKILFLISTSLFSISFLYAQELTESLQIIESSVKDNIYYNFTISGDGYLSYNWGNDNDNFTVIKIDLSGVTISKDFSIDKPKLWINCIDANSCISEEGIIGATDGMYFNYTRTYLPCNSEEDLNAMFRHLSYLIRYSTGQ